MSTAIRSACAEVARRARYVTLVEERVEGYAQALLGDTPAPTYDTAHHFLGAPDDTLAYVVTLDAVNFGSGYFPHLQKRQDGETSLSGYFTVASSLKEHLEMHGPLSAKALRDLHVATCADLFRQDLTDPVRAELMRHFTKALNDLGAFLLVRFDGSFAALVEAAAGSAEQLATTLADMPYFRDVSRYAGFDVPLYKRAQITASDLALAFGDAGYGRFGDLDKLTIFADNLVPHVLRLDGVLHFDGALVSRIQAGELIAPGSPEEVEIRAVALYAVERLVDVLREDGHHVRAQDLDVRLWGKGQGARYKAHPRHRTRTVFY